MGPKWPREGPAVWHEHPAVRPGQVGEGSHAAGTSRRSHVARHVSDLCLLCRPQAPGRSKDRERPARGGLHSGVENRPQAVRPPDPLAEPLGCVGLILSLGDLPCSAL